MTLTLKSVALTGASLLLLGASLGTAEALPVAPVQDSVHAASIDQVSYRYHRHYTSHRRPNRLRSRTFCGHEPSRC